MYIFLIRTQERDFIIEMSIEPYFQKYKEGEENNT